MGIQGRVEKESHMPFLKRLTTFRFVVSSSVWITFSLCLNLICSIKSARIVPNFWKKTNIGISEKSAGILGVMSAGPMETNPDTRRNFLPNDRALRLYHHLLCILCLF